VNETITGAATEKERIYRRWWLLHQPMLVSLFTPEGEKFALSDGAKRLLASAAGEDSLYVITLPCGLFHSPVYIGKSANALARWRSGHVRGLNNSAKKLYSSWRGVLGSQKQNASIYLLRASEILEAPLAGFPTTIGGVEYQLVSLATDFSPNLLNREGAPR
jgi:hypothetical protein